MKRYFQLINKDKSKFLSEISMNGIILTNEELIKLLNELQNGD